MTHFYTLFKRQVHGFYEVETGKKTITKHSRLGGSMHKWPGTRILADEMGRHSGSLWLNLQGEGQRVLICEEGHLSQELYLSHLNIFPCHSSQDTKVKVQQSQEWKTPPAAKVKITLPDLGSA